jgi:hypothetical protein
VPDGPAEACEAFLAGRYGEYLEARGRQVPAWVLLNRLAHARLDELARMAGGDVRLPRSLAADTGLRGALARLAGEVLEQAGRHPGRLDALRLDTLVPLELALVGRDDARYTVPRVTALVRAALRGHPSGGLA